MTPAACVVLGRLTGATSIVHAHVGYGEWMSPMHRWALRRADERLAISSFVAGTLAASGHDPTRTHVTLNGIDSSGWIPREGRSEARKELGLPDTAPVVLTACRLFPEKGPAELIRALPAVRHRHPDVQLLIAGHEIVPGYAAQLADLASALGVQRNVTFLGHRTDVARLMAASDIFAMPSLDEPFGLVYVRSDGDGASRRRPRQRGGSRDRHLRRHRAPVGAGRPPRTGVEHLGAPG